MFNTIELLETIGRDASLRHASRENLSQALNGMNASEGLRLAVVSGDKNHLAQELGYKINLAVQSNQNGTVGGCEPCDDEMENEPDRDSDEKDDPRTPDREP